MKVICLNDMKFSFLRQSMATKCLFQNSRIQLQNYGQNRCYSFLKLKQCFLCLIILYMVVRFSYSCLCSHQKSVSLLVVLAIWSFPLDLFDGLCVYCLVSHSKILHSYGNISIARKELQHFCSCSVRAASEQGRNLIVPHLHGGTQDLGFCGLIQRSAPWSPCMTSRGH